MAVFPRVAGHPDYSSTGAGFIPEIWSGKLQKKFYDSVVSAAISNTDYEGEIKNYGDKVIIRTIPTMSVNNYAKGQNLNYERVTSTPIELHIDKGKYFAFTVDRVDKYQSDIGLMEMWSNDASQQMKIAIDTDFLGNIYTGASAYNYGATAGYRSGNLNFGTAGTPLAVSTTNILEVIVDMGQSLDELNIPEDRFIVAPPWFISQLKKSDLKDVSITGDSTSPIRNGRVGMIDRFELFSSNLLSTTSDGGTTVTNIIFGHKLATTFATQITETETLKAESTFGDLVRGLQVYGYKVVKPEALGWLYAYKG